MPLNYWPIDWANIVNTINSKNQDLNKLINEKFNDVDISHLKTSYFVKKYILETISNIDSDKNC